MPPAVEQTAPQPIAQTVSQPTEGADTPATVGTGDAVERARQAVADLDPAPGLEELEMGAARIEVDDKRMINCRADLNQLVPFKYDWAGRSISTAAPIIGCRKK